MLLITRFFQPENAVSAMEVTESGMVISPRAVQFAKEKEPMEVTESGMETEVR